MNQTPPPQAEPVSPPESNPYSSSGTTAAEPEQEEEENDEEESGWNIPDFYFRLPTPLKVLLGVPLDVEVEKPKRPDRAQRRPPSRLDRRKSGSGEPEPADAVDSEEPVQPVEKKPFFLLVFLRNLIIALKTKVTTWLEPRKEEEEPEEPDAYNPDDETPFWMFWHKHRDEPDDADLDAALGVEETPTAEKAPDRPAAGPVAEQPAATLEPEIPAKSASVVEWPIERPEPEQPAEEERVSFDFVTNSEPAPEPKTPVAEPELPDIPDAETPEEEEDLNKDWYPGEPYGDEGKEESEAKEERPVSKPKRRKSRKKENKEELERLQRFQDIANYDGYYDDNRPMDDEESQDEGGRIDFLSLSILVVGLIVFVIVAIKLQSVLFV